MLHYLVKHQFCPVAFYSVCGNVLCLVSDAQGPRLRNYREIRNSANVNATYAHTDLYDMIDLCHVSGRYCGRTASRDAGEMKGRVLLGLCVWTPGRSQAAPRGGRQTTVRLMGVDRHGWCGRRWAYLGCRPLCLRRSASSDVGQSTGNDGRTALVVEDFGDLHVT